jgi:hypothetical protein
VSPALTTPPAHHLKAKRPNDPFERVDDAPKKNADVLNPY